MSRFQVEPGIVVQPKRTERKYPFAQMEVGDSFFVARDGEPLAKI